MQYSETVETPFPPPPHLTLKLATPVWEILDPPLHLSEGNISFKSVTPIK